MKKIICILILANYILIGKTMSIDLTHHSRMNVSLTRDDIEKKVSNSLSTNKKLENSLKESKSKSVVNRSNKYLGIKYKWGGTSSSGMDCSGFVKRLYDEVGIKLPRVSKDQSLVGKDVSIKDIKYGDLMYFATKGGNRVSHVGVYLGNGELIHASSSMGKIVRINLRGHRLLKQLIKIKRVI